jgi:hypothetical protein
MDDLDFRIDFESNDDRLSEEDNCANFGTMGLGFMEGNLLPHGDNLRELASDRELEDVHAIFNRCQLDSTAVT